MGIVYKSLFIIFSAYLLIKSISYSIYEYKEEKNKYGSLFFLLLVIITIAFSNTMVIINI